MRDIAPLIDINHPRCGLWEFLERVDRTKREEIERIISGRVDVVRS